MRVIYYDDIMTLAIIWHLLDCSIGNLLVSLPSWSGSSWRCGHGWSDLQWRTKNTFLKEYFWHPRRKMTHIICYKSTNCIYLSRLLKGLSIWVIYKYKVVESWKIEKKKRRGDGVLLAAPRTPHATFRKAFYASALIKSLSDIYRALSCHSTARRRRWFLAASSRRHRVRDAVYKVCKLPFCGHNINSTKISLRIYFSGKT